MQITLTTGELRVRVDTGDAVPFTVRDVAYIATTDHEVVVPLTDQGPLIPGRPSLRQFADALREDGTRLSASVPVITTAIPIIETID